MSLAPITANRFFCGRVHRRPLFVWLTDRMHLHQEVYRIRGELGVRKRWVDAKEPGRSVYTCRKRIDHWRLTLKPQGLRWVTVIHDRDFSQEGLDAAKSVKNRRTPYWRARIIKPTRETERVQVPTESWEIGHRYEFTRWQANGSN